MKRKQNSFELDDEMFNPIPNYEQATPINKTKLKSMTLLDKLEQLIKLSRGCRFDDKFFKRHKTLIESTAADLELTTEETVMLCPFISDSESCVNTREMTEYFDCSPIILMRKAENLKTLMHRRYLRKRGSFHGNNPTYQLSEKAKAAFCNNQALPIVNTANLTAEEFMKRFNFLVREAGKANLIDEEELHYETMELLNNNPQLAIARNVNSLRVYKPDKVYLLYFCKRLVVDHQVQIPLHQLEFLASNDIEDEFPIHMNAGRHPFIREGLLELAGQDFLSNDVFQLTDKARKLFLSEYDIIANEEEEAAFVCAEIVAAHRREGAGAHWADFAVLYRSNTQSRPFERQLREHQVPVKVSGGTSFFDTQEVRDLMGWCRVLCNPHDDAALLRIINVPRRGLGTESLAVLAREARRLRRSLYAAATDAGVASQLQPRQLEALTGLLSLIAKLRGELLRYRDLAVVKSLLAEIGYARHLRRSGLSEAAQAYKMANVQQLMDWIAAMVSGERGGRPLSFAQAVERLELRDREGRDEESADAVQLATLHAAKGLEYACVYLVGLEEGILPHHKSLGTPEALGEERRLAYVGITRARRQLTLTHCFERGQGEHRSCNRRSRFIAELPHEMLKIFSPRDNELPEDQETPELLARFQEQLQAVANGQAGWQDFKGSL